jgi:hypothetical protein
MPIADLLHNSGVAVLEQYRDSSVSNVHAVYYRHVFIRHMHDWYLYERDVHKQHLHGRYELHS